METILGLFLLSLLILMVFNLYPSSLMSVRRAEEITQADLLAQSLIEDSAARPFDHLVVDDIYQTQQTYRSLELQATRQIYAVPGTRADLLKRVRVVVAWHSRNRDYSVAHEVLLPYVNP